MQQVTLFGAPETIDEKRARVKARLSKIVFSEPLADPMFRVLSLGMGLQSVTLAFMSARGDLHSSMPRSLQIPAVRSAPPMNISNI